MKSMGKFFRNTLAALTTLITTIALFSIPMHNRTTSVDKNTYSVANPNQDQNTKKESSVDNKTPSLKATSATVRRTIYYGEPVTWASNDLGGVVGDACDDYTFYGDYPSGMSCSWNSSSAYLKWNGGYGSASSYPRKYSDFEWKIHRTGGRKDTHVYFDPLTVDYHNYDNCTWSFPFNTNLVKGETYSFSFGWWSDYHTLNPTDYIKINTSAPISCANIKYAPYNSFNVSFQKSYSVSGSFKVTGVGSYSVNVIHYHNYGGYINSATRQICSGTINLIYGEATNVIINQVTIQAHKGEIFSLYATIGNLANIDPANNYVDWTLSKTGIISFADGKNKTKSGEWLYFNCDNVGTLQITSEIYNGMTCVCDVEITYAPLLSTNISDTYFEKRKGESFDLTCTIDNVENIDPANNKFNWSTSSDQSVPLPLNTSVSGQTINFFCQEVGTVVLTATTYNGIEKKCTIVITYADVKGISLDKNEIDLQYVGGQDTISAELDDTRYVDPNSIIKFTCNDPFLNLSRTEVKQHEDVVISTNSGKPKTNPVIINAHYIAPSGKVFDAKPCRVYIRGIPIKTLQIAGRSEANLGETFNDVYVQLDQYADPKSLIDWSIAPGYENLIRINGPTRLPANENPEFEIIAQESGKDAGILAKSVPIGSEPVIETKTSYITINGAFPTDVNIVSYPGMHSSDVIEGKAGEAGSTSNLPACSAQVLPAKAQQDVVWSIENFSVPSISTWLHINPNDGYIYWDSTCKDGTFTFDLRATTSQKGIDGNPVTSTRPVTLKLINAAATVESIKIAGGPIDETTPKIYGYIGEASQATQFTATVYPRGANQSVSWELVNPDTTPLTGEITNWLSVDGYGRVQWTKDAKFGTYTFKVKATTAGVGSDNKHRYDYCTKDVVLEIRYREPQKVTITQTPSSTTKALGIQDQSSLDEKLGATVSPATARQEIVWSIESVEKIIDDKKTKIDTPKWLKIDSTGLIYWDYNGENKVEIGTYEIKARATAKDNNKIFAISNPIQLTIVYRDSTGIVFTKETYDHLTKIKGYFHGAGNTKEMTGYEYEAIVEPVGQTDPNVTYELQNLPIEGEKAYDLNIHLGKPENGELPNVIYWNDKADETFNIITFKMVATSGDGNSKTPLDIELSFGYADLKEINLDNTEFELSGLPAEGDFSGSIQAITNNMPSLRPNAPESMLYWSTSDSSAIQLLHFVIDKETGKQKLETLSNDDGPTVVDSLKGSTVHFKLLKDNFFGFSYKIYCKSKINKIDQYGRETFADNIVKEITIYKPFPIWLIIVCALAGALIIGLIIWLSIRSHNKKKKIRLNNKK